MRIYNPQNQFGKDLVTKELVSEKLLAITGYSLEGNAPSKTLQAQINDIVEGGLRYKVLPVTSESGDSWTLLKGLIDKQKTTTLTDEEKAKIKSYLKTVILVAEGGGKSGNIYTEYLIFEDTTDHYAYEKIGEIGGDVEELIERIEELEKESVGTITTPSGTGAKTPGAIEIDVDYISGETPKKAVSISAAKAASNQYGVVKLSATGLGDTEYVVTEAQLTAVKGELDGKITNLTNGTTVAVGQVRVATVTITETENVSGVFTITPVTGAATVKILTVEDAAGEEWSHKTVANDTAGVRFQVWNDGTDTTDWDDMEPANRPSGFTVTYVVLSLASA